MHTICFHQTFCISENQLYNWHQHQMISWGLWGGFAEFLKKQNLCALISLRYATFRWPGKKNVYSKRTTDFLRVCLFHLCTGQPDATRTGNRLKWYCCSGNYNWPRKWKPFLAVGIIKRQQYKLFWVNASQRNVYRTENENNVARIILIGTYFLMMSQSAASLEQEN